MMKKKLLAMLFVSILVLGFVQHEPTHAAEVQPPRITSITLNN